MFNEQKAISIVIIRQSIQDPINIRLPVWLLYLIGSVIAIALIILISFLWNYGRLQLKAQLVDRMLVENAILTEKNQKVSELAQQLNLLQDVNVRIREMAKREAGLVPAEGQQEDLFMPSASRENPSQTINNIMMPRESRDELDQMVENQRRAKDFIPSIDPVNQGWISRGFSANRQNIHTGIDIAAPSNSPVHATAAGVVTYADEDSIFGKLVVIDHHNGFVTKYAHNSSIPVKKNQHVGKSEVIAYVGTTGHSTSPHVHYEIWKDGVAIDPAEYIPLKLSTK